jgi:cation:H+ antiporter
MSALFEFGVILICSIVIYFAGEKFAESSSKIGDYFKLPRDVKGATFDAISSSMPELMVALFAVVFFKKFEVGIGTIAGSALFNLLVIPGICVFVAPIAFKVSKKVVTRDALFYLMAVFILVILLIYYKIWGLGIAAILILIYAFYVRTIAVDTKKQKRENKKNNKKNKKQPEKIKLSKEFVIFFAMMGIMGVFTFLLTQSSINLSNLFGISPIIIAFTITAAATSVPDAVISVTNARKGDLDDATSNVFGSNTFDIFIGIGIPLLIYSLYKGGVEIIFNNLEIVLGLLGATILVLYFLADDYRLKKREAAFLLIMYLVFITYVILIA